MIYRYGLLVCATVDFEFLVVCMYLRVRILIAGGILMRWCGERILP